MKQLTIQKLEITNFKGIESLVIDFKNNETYIYGANGTGKTTVGDSMSWLWLGKNTNSKAAFSIKPLDRNNKSAQRVENEVIGTYLINGNTITVKRVHREIWTTRRGDPQPILSGNETLYWWNGTTQMAGEFKKRINDLIPENIFKLITEPYAFSLLDWKERRQILMSMVGEVRDEDIAKTNPDFMELMKFLSNRDMTLEQHKKEISVAIRKSEDEMLLIPARVDEIKRSQPTRMDIDQIQAEIADLDAQIERCNTLITTKTNRSKEAQHAENERIIKRTDLTTKMYGMFEAERWELLKKYDDTTTKAQLLRGKISGTNNEITRVINEIDSNKKLTENLGLRLRAFNLEYQAVKETSCKVNVEDLVCPTCLRPFPERNTIEISNERTRQFEEKKARNLSTLTSAIDGLKEEHSRLSEQSRQNQEFLKDLNRLISERKAELEAIPPSPDPEVIKAIAKKNLLQNKEYFEMLKEYDSLKESQVAIPISDTSLIEAERQGYQDQRDSLIQRVGNQSIIDKNNLRIIELTNLHQDLSQQVADLQKLEFIIRSFEKKKIDLVEDKVNEMFTKVKFKMFRDQLNGGIEPCCEILCDGVPFVDANHASQINAGLEIINMVCLQNDVSAPIFIDNRESITEIIPCHSQLINTVVSPEDKVLRIV